MTVRSAQRLPTIRNNPLGTIVERTVIIYETGSRSSRMPDATPHRLPTVSRRLAKSSHPQTVMDTVAASASNGRDTVRQRVQAAGRSG